MEKELFDKFYECYNPIFEPMITKIIAENSKFYQVNEKIFWGFTWIEDITIMGNCDKKSNLIELNLQSVIHAFKNNLFYDVEYFVNHEIRHIFQHIKIREFDNGIDNGVDKELIKQWKYEEENYIKVKDENGNINESYFKQDIEMDAYAFSLAIMKYKYGEVDLYIPECYGQDFYELVDWWINHFKEEYE